MRKLSLSLVTIAALTLAGCHGDEPHHPTTPPTIAQGVFKDSTVSGLTFESGEQRGVTDASGSFSYEVDNFVTFSVGGVTLGSGIGSPIMTPVDLIPLASSDSPQVKNIVRFLTMLDSTPPLSNGIQISSAAQSVASSWNQLDFTSVDLDADLAGIISDVASVDARTPILLNTTEAKQHLTSTLLCMYSGAFVGRFSGGDQGRIGFYVSSGKDVTYGRNTADTSGVNEVYGIAYSTTINRYARISGDGIKYGANPRFLPVGHNYIRRFISGAPDFSDVDGDSVTAGNLAALTPIPGELESSYIGNFTTPNSTSGEWTKRIPIPATGVFSATRIGGAPDAIHRFTAQYRTLSDTSQTQDAGLFTFDINSLGNVSGLAYSLVNNTQEGLAGTLTPTGINNLQVTTTSGITISATINPSAGTIAGGLWNNGGGNNPFTGSGCRLN
jgi:hypothetical protein